MTTFGLPGVTDRPKPSLGAVLGFLVGVAGLAATITILWLTMREVMGVGGFCASGGPYVIEVECPEVVVALMPVSILGFFVFGGLALWGGISLGGRWVSLLSLGWPALFLSLGWNFLEFGLDPPGPAGGLEWGWLIPGVLFVLMGGVPLAFGIWAIRAARGGTGDLAAIATGTRRLAGAGRGGFGPNVFDPRPRGEGPPDLVWRLQRLERLRDRGELTDAEYEAARQATLHEAGG